MKFDLEQFVHIFLGGGGEGGAYLQIPLGLVG